MSYWISPTNHEVNADWINPAYAYDGHGTTLTYTVVDGSYLILTFPVVPSNKIRVEAALIDQPPPPPPVLYDPSVFIDVWDDDTSAWFNIHMGSITKQQWVEKAFSQRNISKVRFCFETIMDPVDEGFLWEIEVWKITTASAPPLISNGLAGPKKGLIV